MLSPGLPFAVSSTWVVNPGDPAAQAVLLANAANASMAEPAPSRPLRLTSVFILILLRCIAPRVMGSRDLALQKPRHARYFPAPTGAREKIFSQRLSGGLSRARTACSEEARALAIIALQYASRSRSKACWRTRKAATLRRISSRRSLGPIGDRRAGRTSTGRSTAKDWSNDTGLRRASDLTSTSVAFPATDCTKAMVCASRRSRSFFHVMMHPPFDYLSKGPVSNQAMRGSHPHHCAQVAIFDGDINICTDAKSISRHAQKRMAWQQSAAVPFLALASASNEVPPLLHSGGGHWWYFTVR